MNDIQDSQDFNIDDISVVDFGNFESTNISEDIFNIDNNDDISFGDIDDSEIASLFETDDSNKQEPFFETKIDELSGDDTSLADAFVAEDEVVEPEVTDDFANAFVDEDEIVEPEVTDDFADGFVAEDEVVEPEVTDDFADEFVAEDEVVEPEVTDDFADEFVAEDEVVEPEVTDNFADTFVAEDDSFDENQFVDDGKVGAFSVVQPQNLKYIQWYSGRSSAAVYEYGKSSSSGEFIGNRNCNTIHVNVGYDTYGWVVQFSDGVVMSLRDVREYQIRNGKLPNNSGRIIYGQSILSFENVERIVVYEAVKYFSYGM